MVDGGEIPLSEEPPVIEEFDLADILGQQVEEQADSKEDRLRQLAEQVCHLLYARYDAQFHHSQQEVNNHEQRMTDEDTVHWVAWHIT